MHERVWVLHQLIAQDEAKGRMGDIAGLRSRARETKKYATRLRQFLLALHQD